MWKVWWILHGKAFEGCFPVLFFPYVNARWSVADEVCELCELLCELVAMITLDEHNGQWLLSSVQQLGLV